MSLLLDALKTTEWSSAESEAAEAAAESQEEPLDARATLELLSVKPTTRDSLALAPDSDSAATPQAEAAPDIVAEAVPVAPVYVSPPAPGRSLEPAAVAPVPEPAARTPARAPVVPPSPAQRSKRYGLLLVAAVVLAGIGMLAKSLFSPNVIAVDYPETSETPPAAAAADGAPTAASIDAVQVASARPADRFAYSGGAPEIDLGDPNIRPDQTRRPAPTNPESPERPASATSAAAPTAPTVAIPHPVRLVRAATEPTLSVARSEGLSTIDRHVQAGYRALASGDVTIAQTEYLAALELDPNNVDALLGTATAAARDGKPVVASAAYAKVLRLEPGNPDATAAMAMLSSDVAASESNESRLKILIAGDNGNRPVLHAALAGVYAGDARWTEAAQEYFTALGKDPGNPDLAYDVAASLDQNRNTAMALTYYEQALAFARQRPAQIDVHAIEQRIGQLQAHLAARPAIAAEAP
ncbi:MAG TPA: hypothetical protein VNR70_12850 [Steroidobacteraceae bacterium]|nr:hypothetical protein [Steroidobacteraceae bacterium]